MRCASTGERWSAAAGGSGRTAVPLDPGETVGAPHRARWRRYDGSTSVVFEVHGVDARERTVLRKTLRREAVAQFFLKLPPCVVGMAASNGAHSWARVLTDLGHEVRLISPQFVTPYVKSDKNDRHDAEARLARRLVGPRCALCRRSRLSN